MARCLSWSVREQQCTIGLHEMEIECDSCDGEITPGEVFMECVWCGATRHEVCSSACDETCPTNPNHVPLTIENVFSYTAVLAATSV